MGLGFVFGNDKPKLVQGCVVLIEPRAFSPFGRSSSAFQRGATCLGGLVQNLTLRARFVGLGLGLGLGHDLRGCICIGFPPAFQRSATRLGGLVHDLTLLTRAGHGSSTHVKCRNVDCTHNCI